MTDLEITQLCAEAMGLKGLIPLAEITTHFKDSNYSAIAEKCWPDDEDAQYYDPLRDDAQAMALVKKMGLDIHCRADMNGWYVGRERLHEGLFINADLNRAICECVAEIQAAA